MDMTFQSPRSQSASGPGPALIHRRLPRTMSPVCGNLSKVLRHRDEKIMGKSWENKNGIEKNRLDMLSCQNCTVHDPHQVDWPMDIPPHLVIYSISCEHTM